MKIIKTPTIRCAKLYFKMNFPAPESKNANWQLPCAFTNLSVLLHSTFGFANVTLAKSVYPIWGQEYGKAYHLIKNLQCQFIQTQDQRKFFQKYTDRGKQHICALLNPRVLSRIHDWVTTCTILLFIIIHNHL